MEIRILPSLLAADMGNLEAGVKKAESCGADALHVDIMDGHFVSNISMGPAVVEMARRAGRIPLSVHLMISNPHEHDFVSRFIKAGASALFIHVELKCDLAGLLGEIKRSGAHAGLAISPETPAESISPFIGLLDEVVCMTVRPGYGGQAFMPEVLPKIRAVRELLKKNGKPNADILVDGGIEHSTAAQCAAQGANGMVAGTFLYKSRDMKSEIEIMRRKTAGALVP